MLKVPTPVLVHFTILMIRSIYGDAKERPTVDDIQHHQTGNFPGRPLVEADLLSPFVEEHGHTPLGKIPAVFLMMKYTGANNPSYNEFVEGDKMSPALGVTNVSPMELTQKQQDYLEKTTTIVGEQTIKSKPRTEFHPVAGVDILRNQTADLLRNVTIDNLSSIMKMAKILETLKTFVENITHEMLENDPQTKFELLETLSILENISAVFNNGITTQANNVPKPGFKPVKTIADVMALGKRQVSDVANVYKKSFFCPLMYRTAFSVRRCWMFAKLVKSRQARLRRLAAAREMAAKKKFVFSTFRRMTKPSA